MKLYNIKQLSQLLNIHPETLRDWCKSGRIEATKVGREWRISEEHIKGMLDVKETTNNGFFIPNEIWRNMDLSIQERMVLGIINAAGENGILGSGAAVINQEVAFGYENTCRIIDSLVERGYITKDVVYLDRFESIQGTVYKSNIIYR